MQFFELSLMQLCNILNSGISVSFSYLYIHHSFLSLFLADCEDADCNSKYPAVATETQLTLINKSVNEEWTSHSPRSRKPMRKWLPVFACPICLSKRQLHFPGQVLEPLHELGNPANWFVPFDVSSSNNLLLRWTEIAPALHAIKNHSNGTKVCPN